MAFKPERSKLNANFDGYKLGKQSLSCLTQPFKDGVRVARLKEEDYSYQHVRTFSLCNHLAVDPWDGRSVYWCASNGSIFRGRYTGSHGVQVDCVYQCSATLSPILFSVNSSISFISASLCLFSNGCGSLQLLHTPSRGTEDIVKEKEAATWLLLEELKLYEMEGKSFSILSAYYSEADHQLDLATLTLNSGAIDPLGSKKPGTRPPIANYHWHRLCLKPSTEVTDPQCSAGNEDTLATETQLLGSFHSHTVALYSTFISDHLVLLSEADVIPAHQLTAADEGKDTDDSKEDLGEGEVKLESVTETFTQEPDTAEVEEQSESKKFAGLGFEGEKTPSRAQSQLTWTQTESDVTITVDLPDDVTKHDVHCVIDRREVVVGLTDGTTYFRDRLFAPVNPECSTWTIEKHTLEVCLEKQHEQEWPSLREESEGGAAGLSLRGPVADQLSQQELEDLQRKISEATKNEDASPAAKRHHSAVQSAYYEECDLNEDEDATFYILTHTNDLPKKVPLAGRQFLFSSPSLPQTPPIFCLKHDVDALLWQPQPFTSSTNLSWSHVGTFNALAYVQAARKDKKFTVCSPNLKFAALCDCNRHVFVYLQPEEGVKGNTATQYVVTLQSAGDILGLQATDDNLIFVLKENELHVIVVSFNS